MTESSLFWAGTVTGDAGPYTDDAFSDMFVKLFQSDRTLQGPILDMLGELAVTNPAALTIRMASGHALVDGKVYTNTANIDFAVVAPGAGSNYYRLVLRKSFVAQTVRAVMLGPNAVAPDAVTQTDGTTWEISLATIQITSAGVITITDTRDFCSFNTEVVTANIADNAVDDSKVGDRVPQFYRRQGGNASGWATPGINSYTPTTVRMQSGSIEWTGASSPTGNGTVTFPVAFSNTPIVLLTCYDTGNIFASLNDDPGDLGGTGFKYKWFDADVTSRTAVVIFWLAIGPE